MLIDVQTVKIMHLSCIAVKDIFMDLYRTRYHWITNIMYKKIITLRWAEGEDCLEYRGRRAGEKPDHVPEIDF